MYVYAHINFFLYYMRLGVVEAKLKSLSKWSIWNIIEKARFQADEWMALGNYISYTLNNSPNCKLITHDMGTILPAS